MLLITNISFCQEIGISKNNGSVYAKKNAALTIKNKMQATSVLLDAIISSMNSLNSLIKKENYRNRITAFNNPANTDIGFSLESEIQKALKPMLDKSRNVNTNKFSGIISSLIGNTAGLKQAKAISGAGNLFSSIIGMVGNLAVGEKRITREDLDTFIITTNRYFLQYEKLNQANIAFDQQIDKLSLKLQELQFDTREYLLDMISLLYKLNNRQALKSKSPEELLLQYLDQAVLDTLIKDSSPIVYPADAIKSGKDIVYGIQKLFTEYQKIYSDNYNQIKQILLQSKELGKHIDSRQVDNALQELQQLYAESKDADVLNIRLNTLSERLKTLVNAEQMK
jgi:hypothetical protein